MEPCPENPPLENMSNKHQQLEEIENYHHLYLIISDCLVPMYTSKKYNYQKMGVVVNNFLLFLIEKTYPIYPMVS